MTTNQADDPSPAPADDPLDNLSASNKRTRSSNLTIATWNVRGIQDASKRIKIITHLRQNYDIVLIQETHNPTAENIRFFRNQFPQGRFIHCPGQSNTAGVAILITKKLHNFEYISHLPSEDGRLLAIDIKWHNSPYRILSVYAPASGGDAIRQEFFEGPFMDHLYVQEHNIIVGGDFNICLHPLDYRYYSNPEGKCRSASADALHIALTNLP